MSGRQIQRTWQVAGRNVTADLHLEEDQLRGVLRAAAGEQAVDARVHRTARDAVTVRMNGHVHRAVLVRQGTTLWIAVDGHVYTLQVATPRRGDAHSTAPGFATSPMTGVLTKVNVSPGDAVAEGDVLFVVEAMKMEYAVRAPGDAVVESVRGEAGSRVQVDDPVVTFEESA